MSTTFRAALDQLDQASVHALYGQWDPMPPDQLTGLLADSGVRWIVAGGRAARIGAPPRDHSDTDVTVPADALGGVREALRGWHLWEANDGTLKPLLPGVELGEDCEQLWVRRSSGHPWRFELLLDRWSTDREWVCKRDTRVRLPWGRATQTVDGVEYLRPEVALVFKAGQDRPKDRADLLAAQLDPAARDWLAQALDLLGHPDWARLTRQAGQSAPGGATGLIEQDWR